MDSEKKRLSVPIAEQETIINLGSGDQQACIYTTDPVVIRRLYKWAEEYPQIELIRDDGYGVDAFVPKEWISYKPRKKRTMTEEQKAANAERLRLKREAKK